eukprot:sb/3467633/
MTQLLTLAYSHNNRTQGVVENYLNIANVQRVDKMEIPKAVLLDMAQSNGVNELRSDNTMCLGEMMDLLMPLGQLQIQGLSLARLFYQVNKFGVLGCMSNCMAVASPCFSHIKAASGNWDEFARLTNVVINKLDQFGRFYQSSITSIMQLMQIKLADNDVADMCGYDISSNLARNKRSTSSIRTSVLDPTFMETLFSGMDKIHCQRTATENDRCWNGVSVGTNNAVAERMIESWALEINRLVARRLPYSYLTALRIKRTVLCETVSLFQSPTWTGQCSDRGVLRNRVRLML